jgi:hypothetical protein
MLPQAMLEAEPKFAPVVKQVVETCLLPVMGDMEVSNGKGRPHP